MADITPPTPPPQAPAWMNALVLVLTAIAAALGGNHFAGPAPTPTPDGGGGKQVTPPPAPSPNPSPIPTPVPLGTITVADAQGSPVAGAVDPGKLIIVTAPTGISLAGMVQPASDADVAEISAGKLACTLRSGAKLQIIAYGTTGKPTFLTIQANQAPQPPPCPDCPKCPDPAPNPQPNPGPGPQPSPPPTPLQVKKIHMAIVEDGQNRSPAVAKILNNLAEWDKYSKAGNTWTRYDIATPEPNGVGALTALKSAGVSPPGIVFYDVATGTKLGQMSLQGLPNVPVTIQDVTKQVNSYTGGSL